MPQPRQPFLHDLVCALAAPTQAWSAYDGQIGAGGRASGAQGVLHADVRVLSAVEWAIDGVQPEHIATLEEAGGTRFTAVFRHAPGSSGHPDEMLRLDRVRTLAPGRMAEVVTVESLMPAPASVELTLRLAYDLVPVERIKTGSAGDPLSFEPGASPLRWGDDEVTATLDAGDATVRLDHGGRSAQLTWPLTLTPGASQTCAWSVSIEDRGGAVVAAQGDGIAVSAAPERLGLAVDHRRNHRLGVWLQRSLHDLNALRMATPEHPEDTFFAAGAPWYLTLFGRDSLWTARMVAPLDPTPAVGTLRTLARLAGTIVDAASAQEPGKIPHELRRGTFAFGETSLPPLYYGTVDATPLWVCLLHDLWRIGGHEAVVTSLLGPLQAGLEWIVTYGDADGDGLLEYIDSSGHGLANQGWKDSPDSVRFADGRIADGPVALCEVQGYAYEALLGGADVLDAFGRAGGDRYRAWAAALAARFRAQFWCGDGDDRFPALALDGHKQRVDSLTSNIGHLLGTGLLSKEEESLIARRVAGPDLDSGLGLRTMSASDRGYNPLSYHCGSVWPHDTAIVIAGLRRAGLGVSAEGLVEGLLRASVAFDQRLPELWSGEGRPVPYPASCRPQAWSAAAAVVCAQALAG